MSDDSNRFSALFGASGGSGGGGGADEKVKINGSDSTTDFLENKVSGDYTMQIATDTTNPSYTSKFQAVVSRYDDVTSQNFASGNTNTLGGFAGVGITGTQNTAIGNNVFVKGVSLTLSVGVGDNIASTLVSAKQITAIGSGALKLLDIAGDEQVAIGSNVLGANTGNTGGALTGDFNVGVGSDSMILLNGGARNTAIGHNSGGALSTGSRNIVIGFEAGLSALNNLTTGNDNILLGYQADSDGDENLIIGNDSTSQVGSAVANQNTLVGNNISVNSSLQVVMGYNADILNGGQDVLIGVNTSMDGSAFPTFPTLSTHVGSAGNFVGFYNQSLGYNQTINGEDNVAVGNFNIITGNDNISIGNGLTMTTTQSYVMGVDSSSFVDYAFQVSWNNGTQFDDIRLVSKASSVINKSFINVKSDLTIDASDGTLFSTGFLKCNMQFVQQEQLNIITGVATTFTPDFQDGNIVTIDISANGTINAPTNSTNGGVYYFRVVQDAVGSRTLTWNVAYVWAGGSAPTLTTTANKVDIFMVVVASNINYCSVIGQNY
jgi:hypothetical protein